MLTKILHDPNGIVSKLIFEDGDAIWETVAYRHENRGVVCFSVQSGCRVGCVFCGTGKNFIRDLTTEEMKQQVDEALAIIGEREDIQLMCMSMGEPMDNWNSVRDYAGSLDELFREKNPWAFFVSTVGLNDERVWQDFVRMGKIIKRFGLQISLHQWNETKRFTLLGKFPKLMSISDLRESGTFWTKACKKPCYWNYICFGNETDEDAAEVHRICRGMHVTCSVLCDTSQAAKADPTPAIEFANKLLALGDIDVSVFDPAGQDTIGGGCGQLLYVQEKLTRNKNGKT